MTPLRRTALCLALALALTGGVAAVTPAAAPEEPFPLDCGSGQQEPPTYSGTSVVDTVCFYAELSAPDHWPPGAQFPEDAEYVQTIE